jgi:hypothetical protein
MPGVVANFTCTTEPPVKSMLRRGPPWISMSTMLAMTRAPDNEKHSFIEPVKL